MSARASGPASIERALPARGLQPGTGAVRVEMRLGRPRPGAVERRLAEIRLGPAQVIERGEPAEGEQMRERHRHRLGDRSRAGRVGWRRGCRRRPRAADRDHREAVGHRLLGDVGIGAPCNGGVDAGILHRHEPSTTTIYLPPSRPSKRRVPPPGRGPRPPTAGGASRGRSSRRSCSRAWAWACASASATRRSPCIHGGITRSPAGAGPRSAPRPSPPSPRGAAPSTRRDGLPISGSPGASPPAAEPLGPGRVGLTGVRQGSSPSWCRSAPPRPASIAGPAPSSGSSRVPPPSTST